MARPATTRLKTNPPLGRPPVLEWLAPAELNVDETYQRSLEADTSQTLIRKIAVFWDWGLCQPVNVARRADGSLWIVDGQHRHAAAIMRGDIPHLPCVVQSFRDRGEEAAAFVALNKQRRALNAVDVFKASLAAGDQDAAAVMSCITDAGLSIARHQNYVAWKPGQLYCIPTIQSGYRRHGRVVVSSALCALAEAFEGQVLNLAGYLLDGLIPFYANELREDAFEPDVFIEMLSQSSQSEWLRRARTEMARAEIGRKEAMRSVLTAAYLDALGSFLEAA
jgi:hypothetical protein